MYKAGVSLEEFGKLNMKHIHYIANAYAEKQESEFKIADVMAFIQGRYMVDALLCTVGNMFGGKNSKFEYPEQAYSMKGQEKELTQDEIEQQRQQFIATLQTMERNFNKNKERNSRVPNG